MNSARRKVNECLITTPEVLFDDPVNLFEWLGALSVHSEGVIS